MKPDTRNVLATFALVAASLGIGRTGFVWNERMDEQAERISELEDELVEAASSNSLLTRDLEVARRDAARAAERLVERVVVDDEEDDRRVAVQEPSVSQVDIAFMQSAVEQLQLLQNQQEVVTAPEPTPKNSSKSTTNTPKKRSRTTRAS